MDVAPPVNDDPLNVIEIEEDNTHKLSIEGEENCDLVYE